MPLLLIAFDYVPCNYIKKAGKTLRSDLNWPGHRSLCGCAQSRWASLVKFVVEL